jgi:hypothetical protein
MPTRYGLIGALFFFRQLLAHGYSTMQLSPDFVLLFVHFSQPLSDRAESVATRVIQTRLRLSSPRRFRFRFHPLLRWWRLHQGRLLIRLIPTRSSHSQFFIVIRKVAGMRQHFSDGFWLL